MPIASGLEFVILPALPATDPDNPGAPNLFLRTFDVAAIADGGLVVTWDTDEGDAIGQRIFAQSFHNGTASGQPLLLTPQTSQYLPNNGFPDVASLSGSFIVSWTNTDEFNHRSVHTSFNGGASLPLSTPVFPSIPTSAVSTLSQNRAIVTWKDSGALYGRTKGDLDSGQFKINTTSGADTPAVASQAAFGRFMATWHSTDSGDGDANCIRARVFNTDGSAIGNDFVVNSTALAQGSTPSVAALPDGRFLVVWDGDDNGDGAGSCIRGRYFGTMGAPVGNDFIVNTTATGNQVEPSIATLADGRIAIAWASDEVAGDGGTSIRVRLFNVDGTPAGGDFLVNANTSDDEFDPVVTALPDGRFAVSWQNYQVFDDVMDQAYALYFDPRIYTGTTGNDVWTGGNLVDTISGDNGNDTLSGLLGNDILSGGLGDDTLNGGDGDDILDGGNNNDTLNGGKGNDTLWAGFDDGNGDANNGGDGVDTVLIHGTPVDGFAFNIDLRTATDNYKNTYSSIEVVIGGKVADTLIGTVATLRFEGKGGDDTFRVFSAATEVRETAGEGSADRVIAAVSYALEPGSEIELLTTNGSTGTSAIDLTGNSLAQEIVGNYGNNVLHDGGVGAADTLKGLNGNDTYRIFNAGDVIVEAASQGAADRVMAAVDYTLGTGVHVELMTTNGSAGTSGINLTGNEIAQSITGNAGSNILDGKGGGDTLKGLGGKDFFVFSTALGAANVDTIADFNAADDTIRLENAVFAALTTTGALAASAFKDLADGPKDASDRVIYNSATGNLYYDADGSGSVFGNVKFAGIANLADLTAADFAVI